MIKYAAHLILAVRFRDKPRQTIPCYENVVLVYAADDEEALEKAKELGAEAAADEFDWDGHPARWEFVGVRKLIECRTPRSADNRLGAGTEVTYSQLVLSSEEDLQKFVAGEPVTVTYEE